MQNVIQVPKGRERTAAVRANLRRGTVKDVRQRLADHSRISAKTWIHIGKSLIDVRDDLATEPKAFADLFATTAKERKDDKRFPFSYSTARQLICIAESDVTSCNTDSLPPSWRALYSLSRLPSRKLSEFIKSGAIHPMMTVSEASKLAGTKKRKKPPAERTYDRAYSTHLSLLKRFDEKKRALELIHLIRDAGVTLEELQELDR